MNVFIILGVLFLALVILIPLLEKSNAKMSDETTAKISKWIWPLMIVLIGLGAFKAFM